VNMAINSRRRFKLYSARRFTILFSQLHAHTLLLMVAKALIEKTLQNIVCIDDQWNALRRGHKPRSLENSPLPQAASPAIFTHAESGFKWTQFSDPGG